MASEKEQIIPRYQSLLAQHERELERLRELRHTVLAFLDRRASFGELRHAVNQSEVIHGQ